MIKIAILASGNGTNAEKLCEFSKDLSNIKIDLIVTDNPKANLLQRLRRFNIPMKVVPFPKDIPKKQAKYFHDNKMLEVLKSHTIEWVFLAGYMRILSAEFIKSFYDENLNESKIINIHPSLLPKYPGLNSFQRAYDANDKHSGITIHFVDQGVDTGTIIAQEKFKRLDKDDLSTFECRGHELEYRMYPAILKHLNDNKTITPQKVIL